MRYFVRFSYCGTAYHGSQTQPNGITVQEVMEKAFSTILRCPVALTFAGRTDAGVHAEMMFAHFDFQNESEPLSAAQRNNLVLRLNSLLPADIAVREIFSVRPDAHARFDALSRTYEYRVCDYKNPFLPNLLTRVASGLDYNLMNVAAAHLLGTRDFASFCRVHTDVKTTICNVTHAQWTDRGDMQVFTITADRFLRNMVRAVVGTLFEVGRGHINPDRFSDIIATHNRCAAGQSAPAEGLYLVNITYPDDISAAEC